MNQDFVRFTETMNIARYSGTTLTDEQRREIEKTSEQHVRQYATKEIGRYNICVVHPYFLQLEWNGFYAELMGLKRDNRPAETLEKVLRNVDGDRYSTILFEDYPSYVYRSHELVEEGVIDKVIFTGWKSGVPIHEEDMHGFSSSEQNYVGGAIAHQCVQQAINHLRKYAPYFSIRPIRDAVSYHEPKLWQKTLAWAMWPSMLQHVLQGNWAAVNDNKLRFLARTYTLLRGVDSDHLLE